MLVVIAVLAILFATATPVAMGVLQSSRLNSAGEACLGRLIEAQQMAIAQDTDVEVRILEGADLLDKSPRWCAIQLFTLKASDTLPTDDASNKTAFQTAGAALRLDSTVAVRSDAKLSSVFNLKNVTDNATTGFSHYVAFRFHSDGSTDLTPGKTWFLTLAEASAPTTSTPANYYTIQVDPATGRLRTYRP